MKSAAHKFTSEQKAEIIEAARFAHARPQGEEPAWREEFRQTLTDHLQALAAEEFQKRKPRGRSQAN